MRIAWKILIYYFKKDSSTSSTPLLDKILKKKSEDL
jgi:hypothetical protein